VNNCKGRDPIRILSRRGAVKEFALKLKFKQIYIIPTGHYVPRVGKSRSLKASYLTLSINETIWI
jgi:hypothetical protein